MDRRRSSPRQDPPDRFTLFVCRACGAWDLGPDEIVHNSKRCEGRADPGHIERVIARKVEGETEGPSGETRA